MRSGWQQTPPDADQRRPPFGPEVSWPTGYYELNYREGDYDYPQGNGYPGEGSGGQAPRSGGPYGDAALYAERPPYGEHPYAAPGPAPDLTDYGYGDPGYQDPRYEGPDYQGGNDYRGAAPRGERFPGDRSPGGRFSGGPIPGEQRLGNQWSGAYPALPGAANDPRYDDPRLGDPSADIDAWFDDPDYGGSGYDLAGDGGPGYGRPGYGDSGYDAPGYDTPGYDIPGYDAPGYGEPRQFDGPRQFDETQFDMPRYEEPGYEPPRHDGPRYDETRFDIPRYDEQQGHRAPGPGYDLAKYEGPPARGFSGHDSPRHDETRFDMPALSAPTIESSDFELDVYRDPDLITPAYGPGPGPAGPVGPRPGFAGQGAGPATMRSDFAGTGPTPANLGPAWPEPVEPAQGVLPHTGMMLAVEADPQDWSDPAPARQGAALLEELNLPQTGQFEAVEDYPLEQRQQQSGKAARTGQRRAGSRDRRQWLAIVAVVIVAAGAIAAVLKFAFPSHHGPAHTMATPNTIGAYTRKPALEKDMNVGALVANVRKMSGGQATGLKSGVYQAGSISPGGTAQIFMYIGGHLANADPGSSINSFIAKFPGAKMVSAGSMGGQAACVEASAGTQGKVAMCIWFDNDSFGELVSPTMTTSTLANVLVSVRPSLEVTTK